MPLFYSTFFCWQHVLGTWSSKLFAIALLASGQSSTITGTYAGQYVMQVSSFSSFSLEPLVNYLCVTKRRFLFSFSWPDHKCYMPSKLETNMSWTFFLGNVVDIYQ